MIHRITITIVLLMGLIHFQSCKAQQVQSTLPKIENYTKGELEIKVTPFGLDDAIPIGKITADGTIHFNFPEIDLGTTDETPFYSTQKLDKAFRMYGCHDKEILQNTETVTAIEVKDVSLYKYGQRVGALLNATEKEVLTNEFLIGSKLSWFLSSGDGELKTTCTAYEDDGLGKGGLDKNKLHNKTSYNISFKKGWNMVEHKLLKTKDLEDDRGKYYRRLIEEKVSVSNIPETMNWYLKYWANDELLEIEQQLATQTPITKQQFESWMPKKMGNLKRTVYEIGKELERMPTLNNIELLFEKGDKKATVTIVDCANSKEAASMYTLMHDMASRDWKDKTDTGYRSASKIDNTRVMVDYNENDVKTMLSYNTNDRLLVKAEATNITPEELWEHLKTLDLEKLIKQP